MSMFKKATRKQVKLRLAIGGPSGAGKTYTALAIGKHMGSKMAVIDTERGSAALYSGDVADFDTVELDYFSVEKYLDAICAAAKEGYDVLVVDSLSHAWAGKGGILEEADRRGGKFGAWRELTPKQQRLVDAILSYPGHVICTMRSKMSYEVSTDDSKGRKETKVEKLGLAHVQRDDLSYEFSVVFDMDEKHNARVTKTRCKALTDAVIHQPGKDVADLLLKWLGDGAPEEAQQERPLAETSPASTNGKARTSTAETATPATDTDEARAQLWRQRYEAIVHKAIESKVSFIGEDEHGLPIPGIECPRFEETRKNHPGKAFNDPSVPPGYVREVVCCGNDFAKRAGSERLWALYVVAAHEAGKVAKKTDEQDTEPPFDFQVPNASSTEAAQ